MSIALRVVLLPVFASIGFLVYGNALGYLATVIATDNHSLIFGSLLLQGLLAATLVATLLCYPIAWVFRQHSPHAALAICLPVLVLQFPEFLDSSRHIFALVISGYEVLAYTLLLVLGTWLVHRQYTPNPALHTDAPQAARR